MKPKIDSVTLDYLAGVLASDSIFCENLAAAMVKHKDEHERELRVAERNARALLHRFIDLTDNKCVRCGEELWFKDNKTNLNAKCPKAVEE